jgi:hypothetical protein
VLQKEGCTKSSRGGVVIDNVHALRERSCGCYKIIEHQYRQHMKERRAEHLAEVLDRNLRSR